MVLKVKKEDYNKKSTKEHIKSLFSGRDFMFWLFVFVFLVTFFWLTPLSGDDYNFIAYSNNIHNIKEHINAVIYMHNNLNGRLAGNTSAILFINARVLSSAVRASIVLLIMFLSYKILKIKSKSARNILVLAIFLLPIPIFRQAYVWSAGFYNYVTPVALFLFIVYILSGNIYDKSRKHSYKTISLMFGLGLVSSLFTENFTLSMVIMSVGLAIWSAIKARRTLRLTASLLAGSVVGATVMFSSKVYWSVIIKGNDPYGRAVGVSVKSILRMIRDNILDFSHLLISQNTVLHIAIAIACLIILFFYKPKKINTRKSLRKGLAVMVALVSVYFMFSGHLFCGMGPGGLMNLLLLVELFALSVFFFSVFMTVLLFVDDTMIRDTSVFFLSSALLFVLPLLFVKPFGGRNFYVSSILLIMFTSSLYTYIGRYIFKLTKIRKEYVFTISSVMIGLVGAVYLTIFSMIRATELKNESLVKSQISSGSKTIELNRYPFPDYIHFPHEAAFLRNVLLGQVCDYDRCNQYVDITVTFKE